jgi:hypothetical protein
MTAPALPTTVSYRLIDVFFARLTDDDDALRHTA